MECHDCSQSLPCAFLFSRAPHNQDHPHEMLRFSYPEKHSTLDGPDGPFKHPPWPGAGWVRLACQVQRTHWECSSRLRAKACLPAPSFLIFLHCPLPAPLPCFSTHLLSFLLLLCFWCFLVFSLQAVREWLVEEQRTEAEKGRQGTAERPLSIQTVKSGWPPWTTLISASC